MGAQVDLNAVRDEVQAWLSANWRPGTPARDFLPLVVDAGYAVPSWAPEWSGRGYDGDAATVVEEEFRRVGAPGAAQDKHNLWANTMLAFGSDEAKQRFIRPLLLQQVNMCLLYSEPGAGSDLAAIQTRADADGDEWVVNGQKVWTSSAATAEYGMLIARTDWDVPKHQGITFFWFPMQQPGVEVRPIRQITDEAHFNEVFITDARVPDSHRVGPLNGGWRVLQTALAYERSVMGDLARGPRRAAGSGDGASVDLVELARRRGRNTDPVVRQRIAHIYALRAVNRWNALRAKAQLEQGTPSPIMSLGKLAMSGILHGGAAVQHQVLGAEAMLTGEAHPEADDANFLALNAYFTSIGGGTDQIQRNIIGERVLGLPKEPETDRGIPFKDVPKATVARPPR
jgi:alkylation response protein AidB-like acyl-CoA dehydrogenase